MGKREGGREKKKWDMRERGGGGRGREKVREGGREKVREGGREKERERERESTTFKFKQKIKKTNNFLFFIKS